MKILQIAPLWASVPPKAYGGTELVVSQLTEGLVGDGNDVTLYASGDSKTDAKLKSCVQKALGEGVESGKMTSEEVTKNEVLLNSQAFREANDYDIVHAHTNYLGSAFSNFVVPPTIITLHHYPVGPELEIMKQSKACFVSISNKFREFAPGLNYVATIYNGVVPREFTYEEENVPEHLVAIGRISPNKGLGEAIEAALKTESKLKIAGPLPKKAIDKQNWLINEPYFKEKVEPYLDKEGIEHVGEISKAQKASFYVARAFLFPIQWEEPFGLVMAESMACGTPVIAFARGSVPELIEDGKTGFIVNCSESDKRGDWIIKESGIRGIEKAIEKIKSMGEDEYRKMRQACRKRVEDNFSVEKMVDGYSKVYKELISSKSPN